MRSKAKLTPAQKKLFAAIQAACERDGGTTESLFRLAVIDVGAEYHRAYLRLQALTARGMVVVHRYGKGRRLQMRVGTYQQSLPLEDTYEHHRC